MQAQEGQSPAFARTAVSDGPVRVAHVSCDNPERALAAIVESLGGTKELAFLVLFCAPSTDREALAASLADHFGEMPVFGCTTAGEIGPRGYAHDSIVAIGFSSANFALTSHLVSDLHAYSLQDGSAIASALLRPSGLGEAARWDHGFALLIADGLSRKEDAIVASLAPLLGDIPLIGGSAGDATDFRETFVLHGGRFHRDAAVVALVRTRCPVKIRRFENFTLTEKRMVVTAAIPSERLVTEINAEPAAREYARMVGMDPDQLSPFIFASHPVVVRVGGDHYCRSIQKVEDNGDLRFYSAIDEGLVLTLAESTDIVENLDARLSEFSNGAIPEVVLGFDCVLRRLEAQMTQRTHELSEVMARHRVVGFSTYGEQHGGMHVNQTFTCAAIYPPTSDGSGNA